MGCVAKSVSNPLDSDPLCNGAFSNAGAQQDRIGPSRGILWKFRRIASRTHMRHTVPGRPKFRNLGAPILTDDPRAKHTKEKSKLRRTLRYFTASDFPGRIQNKLKIGKLVVCAPTPREISRTSEVWRRWANNVEGPME